MDRRTFLTGLGAAVLSPQTVFARDTPIVCEVPVLEYRVRKGDTTRWLMRAELKDMYSGCLVGVSTPLSDNRVFVRVAKSRNDYDTDDIIEKLNPPKNEQEKKFRKYYYPNDRFALRADEKILIPDFNGDGNIGQYKGVPVGKLQVYTGVAGEYGIKFIGRNSKEKVLYTPR